MSGHRLPVLRADGSSLDWGATGRFESDIEFDHRDKITMQSHIEGAPGITQLADRDDARIIVEIRSRRTLTSKHIELSYREASMTVQHIEFDPKQMISADAFVLVGMATIKDCHLDRDGLNPRIWPASSEPLELPVGWWLVEPEASSIEQLADSLIRWHEDPDLDDGCCRVAPSESEDRPRFVVWLAPNLYKELERNRDLQVAGCIGVFACLPNSPMRSDREWEKHPITQELRAWFARQGLPDWDSDDFDPVHAATTFEPFKPDLRTKELPD